MNTSPKNQNDLRFGAGPRPARQPKRGELLWAIRKADGVVLICELRDQGEIGAEIHMQRNGDFLFSRRHPSRWAAMLDATATKAEYLDGGGTLIDC